MHNTYFHPQVEEIFRLQAEVSALTFQTASLREDNSELQQILLDQETSFSYALRNCHAERMEREQRIGRVEEQVRAGVLGNPAPWASRCTSPPPPPKQKILYETLIYMLV